ncbi:MAG: hypothetical protein R3C19_17575 [Planctomycetaceae bacterium]
MTARFPGLFVLPAAVALIGISGCGSSVEIPRTVPVKGKVTYKDQPLADAEVAFVSKLDNKDVLAARGMTNSAGEFSLTTYIDPQHEVSGATPGDYVVTVNKSETMSTEQTMKMFKENPMMEFKKLVPDEYTLKDKSPLEASVTVGGENTFDFTLKD